MDAKPSKNFRRRYLRDPQQFPVAVNTNRLEAFSDGVFAIAITLLILQVRIPSYQELKLISLENYLLRLWPNIVSYVFSFVILGAYWANHHYIFILYKRTDHLFNLLNVLFLMTIAFLPFPSAILGHFIANPEHIHTAVTFYSIGIFLPAFMWFIIWIYASQKKRLIDEKLSSSYISHLNKVFTGTVIIYLIAIFVSLWSAKISLCISVLLTLLYLLPLKTPEYETGEEKKTNKQQPG